LHHGTDRAAVPGWGSSSCSSWERAAMARGLSRELSKAKNLKNQSGAKGRTDDMTPAQRAEQ
jgi:hypothetical protein